MDPLISAPVKKKVIKDALWKILNPWTWRIDFVKECILLLQLWHVIDHAAEYRDYFIIDDKNDIFNTNVW